MGERLRHRLRRSGPSQVSQAANPSDSAAEKHANSFRDSLARVFRPELNLATQKGETKINPDTPREARTGARWNRYLDGGFGQVERSGQLTPAGPRYIVLPVELLLQARDLFAGERRAVAPHLICTRAGAAQRRAPTAAASMQAAEAGARRRRRGARGRTAFREPWQTNGRQRMSHCRAEILALGLRADGGSRERKARRCLN